MDHFSEWPTNSAVIDPSGEFRLFAVLAVCILVSVGGMVLHVGITSRENARAWAVDSTRLLARMESDRLYCFFHERFSWMENVALSLERGHLGSSTPDRLEYSAFLKNVLQRSTLDIFGVWTIFLPNQFDGRDALFAGKPDQSADGLFNVYYFWENGNVAQRHETLAHHKGRPYFDLPLSRNAPCMVDPYPEETASNVLITSLALPIRKENRFSGVLGIDVLLDKINVQLSRIGLPEGGYAFLIAPNGLIVGHSDLVSAGLDVESTGFRLIFETAVRNKGEYEDWGFDPRSRGPAFRHFLPLTILPDDSPMVLGIILPEAFMVAKANLATMNTAMLGVISLGILVALLFLLAKRVIIPLETSREVITKSEERFRSLAETLPAMVVEVDPEGKLTYINRAGYSLTGYSSAEFRNGLNALQIFAPREHEVIKANMDRLLLGEFVPPAIREGIKKDGTPFMLHVETVPIRHGGIVVGIRGILFDISDRVQVEKELLQAKDAAEQASRSKSDFLAMMSHELRTPLSSVLAYSLLLEDPKGPLAGQVSPEARTFGARISTNAKHLLDIIDDLLSLAHAESGRFSISRGSFSLADVTSFILEEIEARNSDSEIGFSMKVPDGEVILFCDSRAVRQILLNLLGNAFKFTHQGEVRVEFQVQDLDLVMTVADSGIGIPESEWENVFSPFTQLSRGSTRKYPGTGLGLAIVKQLVSGLGGSITIGRSASGGALFTVILAGVVQPPAS